MAAYREVLHGADRPELFRLIEVAEATIRVLDVIRDSTEDRAEREAIADALTQLSSEKRDRLGFHSAD
jgi:hypothetical protein